MTQMHAEANNIQKNKLHQYETSIYHYCFLNQSCSICTKGSTLRSLSDLSYEQE